MPENLPDGCTTEDTDPRAASCIACGGECWADEDFCAKCAGKADDE